MSDEARTFVVGVDASDDADQALQWARGTAGPDDAIVAVLGLSVVVSFLWAERFAWRSHLAWLVPMAVVAPVPSWAGMTILLTVAKAESPVTVVAEFSVMFRS